jgi:hypothetical protein
MRQFNAQAYNWLPDGTDHSTEMLALLADVYSAGGGEIFFPPTIGMYRADSQMFIPNNGVTPQSKQPSITLLGAAPGPNWWWTNAHPEKQPPLGPSTLDLRYQASDGNAKIETRGLGTLRINGITIIDTTTSGIATPFIHSTNTTLLVEYNSFVGNASAYHDAIVLGGPSSTTVGNLVGSPFQGYCSIVNGNCFAGMSHGVFGRTFANAVSITNNSFPLIGYNVPAAIEFDGASSGAGCYGEYIAGNTIEMGSSFSYAVKGSFMVGSLIAGNGFYDGDNFEIFDVFWNDANCISNTLIGNRVQNPAKYIGGNATSIAATTIIGAYNVAALQMPAASLNYASCNVPIATGTPTAPNSGDIWFDGTHLYMQIGGVTKTIV